MDSFEINGMITTLKDFFKAIDEGSQEPWSATLLTNAVSDPKLFLYSCCCPCVLAGQISQKQGRNCLSSCLCNCCCGQCHLCAFAVPDRRQVGKSNIIEDCVVMSLCGGCCGRVQLAKELGIGVPEDANQLKEDAKKSGEKMKEEVAPDKKPDAPDKKTEPADAPAAEGASPAPETMLR